MAKTTEAKTKTYWAPYAKYAFYVPIINPETNKPEFQKHPYTGALIYSSGKPVMNRIQKNFETISTVISKGLWCRYEATDPVDIQVLDGLVADQTTSVMTEEQRNKIVDPAFDEKKKLAVAQAQLSEKDEVIAKMQRELEDLTRPTAKGK
jgi:hypothetical protein